MHLHPAARYRAGFQVMIAATSVAVLTGLTCSSPALGQKPGDIIKHMQALYTNASTYQGTIKQGQSGKTPQGVAFTFSQTQVITFRKPNQVYIQINMTGTGAAAQVNGNSTLVVCDGKSIYQYDPKKHLYVKQPAPPKVQPLVGASQVALIPFDLVSAKVVKVTSVDGRSAVVIEAVPDTSKVPAAQRAAVLKQIKPVQLTIDKSSYALLRLGSPAQPSAVELSGQVFNGSVSGSTFAFTPPAGAKLYTPPPSQGMPGGPQGRPLPGVSGGAPHR